jgi:chromosome segregation ATPase
MLFQNLQALAASGEHSGLGDVSLRSNADRSVSLDDVTSLKAQITQLETSKADLQKRLANAEMEAEESDNALRSAKEDAAHIEAHKAQVHNFVCLFAHDADVTSAGGRHW